MMTVEYANGGPRTPRFNHKPLNMRRRTGADVFEQAGDFFWAFELGDKRTLVVAIPCIYHRGWIHSEWTISLKNDCDTQWSWNGDEEKPTLTPSLHAVGTWHGYVRNGQLVEA